MQIKAKQAELSTVNIDEQKQIEDLFMVRGKLSSRKDKNNKKQIQYMANGDLTYK